ncbi:MAG: hypothetical protein MMC33_009710 [Icmadophila ericetorum]|nr:hypothetical protein [Icmadophila ericetorum]
MVVRHPAKVIAQADVQLPRSLSERLHKFYHHHNFYDHDLFYNLLPFRVSCRLSGLPKRVPEGLYIYHHCLVEFLDNDFEFFENFKFYHDVPLDDFDNIVFDYLEFYYHHAHNFKYVEFYNEQHYKQYNGNFLLDLKKTPVPVPPYSGPSVTFPIPGSPATVTPPANTPVNTPENSPTPPGSPVNHNPINTPPANTPPANTPPANTPTPGNPSPKITPPPVVVGGGIGSIIASMFSNPIIPAPVPHPSPSPKEPPTNPPDQGNTAPPPSPIALSNPPTIVPSNPADIPSIPVSIPPVIPTPSPKAPNSAVTSPPEVSGVAVSVELSVVIIGASTIPVSPNEPPRTVTVQGQTFTVGPSGISVQSTFIPIPIFPLPATSPPSPPPLQPDTIVSTLPNGALTTLISSAVVISGSTIIVPTPGSPPITATINGQPITIGPSGIIIPQPQQSPPPIPTEVLTENGVTVSVIPSFAIIQGTTFAIGPNASPTAVIVGSETVSLGPGIVILQSTTITENFGAPTPQAPIPTEVITENGVTVSVVPSFVIISGTTYAIGPSASRTEVVVGSETISLGPGIVILPSTTITETFGGPTATGSEFAGLGSSLRFGPFGRIANWRIWDWQVGMGLLATYVSLLMVL